MKKYTVADCIFCKISLGEVQAERVWENDEFYCIKDKFPSAPVHLLVIPKSHVSKVSDTFKAEAEYLGRYLQAVFSVIKQEKLDELGYKIGNVGGGYQSIDHEHIHVISGVQKVGEGEMKL